VGIIKKGESEMKIIISSEGKDLDSKIAEVFGRCSYFLFVEIEDQKIKEFEAVENKNINQAGGVGVSVAQMVAEKNAGVVISGAVGPRALEVLKQFDIQVYKASGSIKEAIQKFIEGKLQKIL